VNLQGRRDDVVEFTRAVGDDSSKYCSSNLRWPLRMRRRGSAMQDVEPRCDKVKQ
jgi:hypothetical protein